MSNLRLMCTNEKCLNYSNLVYRRFDTLKTQICKGCGLELRQHKSKLIESRRIKAKQQYEKIQSQLGQ